MVRYGTVWPRTPSTRPTSGPRSPRPSRRRCPAGRSRGQLLTIGLVIARTATSSGNAEDLQAGRSLASVVVPWAVVHTVFTLRSARLSYEGGQP